MTADRCAQAADRLRALRERAQQAATASGRHLVFGEGNSCADLVIVGEAPGAEEEEQGRPFVGPAGRLLTRLLAEVGLTRDQVYITNVVKHRPTAVVGGRVVNRPPRAAEIRADRPWLDEELAIIRPRVILCLGNIAARTLIGPHFRFAQDRGRWFTWPDGTRLLATYHPAWVLRQVGPARDAALQTVREDLRRVKEYLASLPPRQDAAAD